MIRRSGIEIIDFTEYDENIRYCKSCLEYGFQVALKNRLYENNQIAVDHEDWLQCYQCGSIYSVNEVQQEAKIKDVVEKIENPLDIAKNEFLGVDSRKSARKKRERKHDYDWIKDEDLKRELRKGAILESYSEQIPQ